MKAPLLNTPSLYEQLDLEALFFMFYFQPHTYQQILAAKELKRQSWRYHTQHKAWFQRHDNPTTITEEYEQGSYVYFDWNLLESAYAGWCYRVKQGFRIEYAELESQI